MQGASVAKQRPPNVPLQPHVLTYQTPLETIPKFVSVLRNKTPLLIYGDGQHTCRCLYAGGVASALDTIALDTILHRCELGQTYKVDSP